MEQHTITQTLCPIRVCVSAKHCFVGPPKALEKVFLYLSLNSEIVKNDNIVLLAGINQSENKVPSLFFLSKPLAVF